jgi:uncharacterized protein DUF6941
MQRPVASGLVVCEQAVVEEGTRRVTLVNVFDRLRVGPFPSGPQQFVVFANLSDGLGDVNLELVVHRLDNFAEIFRQSKKLRFADRLQQVKFLFRVTQCSFPVSGPYQVLLRAEGNFVAQRRILVT